MEYIGWPWTAKKKAERASMVKAVQWMKDTHYTLSAPEKTEVEKIRRNGLIFMLVCGTCVGFFSLSVAKNLSRRGPTFNKISFKFALPCVLGFSVLPFMTSTTHTYYMDSLLAIPQSQFIRVLYNELKSTYPSHPLLARHSVVQDQLIHTENFAEEKQNTSHLQKTDN